MFSFSQNQLVLWLLTAGWTIDIFAKAECDLENNILVTGGVYNTGTLNIGGGSTNCGPEAATASSPTVAPESRSPRPTNRPSPSPTLHPTNQPTLRPSGGPTHSPTLRPTQHPTALPTLRPSSRPTSSPTMRPTGTPTNSPTVLPSSRPSQSPQLEQSTHEKGSSSALTKTTPAEQNSSKIFISLAVAVPVLLVILLGVACILCRRFRKGRKKKLSSSFSPKKLVFLSFTGQEKPAMNFTDFLSRELQRRKISVFLDETGIPPGDKFAQVLEAKARGCSVFVCIISQSYFDRYWCMRELDIAMQNEHCTIIPVLHEYQLPRIFDEEAFRRCHQSHVKHRVTEEELVHWCDNIRELRKIQRLEKSVTGRRAESVYVEEAASAVEQALERDQSSCDELSKV